MVKSVGSGARLPTSGPQPHPLLVRSPWKVTSPHQPQFLIYKTPRVQPPAAACILGYPAIQILRLSLGITTSRKPSWSPLPTDAGCSVPFLCSDGGTLTAQDQPEAAVVGGSPCTDPEPVWAHPRPRRGEPSQERRGQGSGAPLGHRIALSFVPICPLVGLRRAPFCGSRVTHWPSVPMTLPSSFFSLGLSFPACLMWCKHFQL